MFDCILLMAGKGLRTGLSYNKDRFKVNGKELYTYPLNTFLSIDELGKVIIVCNKDDYEDVLKDISNYPSPLKLKIEVCLGGDTRKMSMIEGLKHAERDICLVHDGARANILKEDILKVYEGVKKYNACALAKKCNNALKIVKDDFVLESVDRTNYVLMETPQGFKKDLMMEALNNYDKDAFDDMEILEKALGIKAYIVYSSNDNIKLTTNQDLKYVEYLLGDK